MEIMKGESSYHEDTELTLGLPGSNKRKVSDISEESNTSGVEDCLQDITPPKKVRAIGWPPIRSYRKNCLQITPSIFVKVSMDGAPFLRKVDLKLYQGYTQLLKALEDMFKFKVGKLSNKEIQSKDGSEYEATYEDKDGDWMLVGDVPWEMFTTTCKRLRIMKGSERVGPGLVSVC